MIDRQLWRFFDWWLLAAVFVLSLVGIAMVYSATAQSTDLQDYWLRQSVFLGIGILFLLVGAVVDYRHLEAFGVISFLILMLSLVAVILFGDTQETGAQRWISVGGTLVQPTEAGKFALIIFLAWFLSRFYGEDKRFIALLAALALLILPLVLVYSQPDLGMTITMAFISAAMILVSGMRLSHFVILTGGLVAAIPFLWGSLQGYMLERIAVFLNPEQNLDAAFNVRQALISVGSGGLWGQGWLAGTQNQLFFLRVRHSDFIFSVIAEELGLIGTVLLLFLIFFVIWRLLRIVEVARDDFGRLVATGVAAIIFFQSFINVGMNLSLVPVTGITLPFISYGGSSLISLMFSVGLAQSVLMRHRKIDFT